MPRRFFPGRFPRGEDDQDLDRDQIFPLERCDWCGQWNCECDDDEEATLNAEYLVEHPEMRIEPCFDADELGLDPEDDADRRS